MKGNKKSIYKILLILAGVIVLAVAFLYVKKLFLVSPDDDKYIEENTEAIRFENYYEGIIQDILTEKYSQLKTEVKEMEITPLLNQFTKKSSALMDELLEDNTYDLYWSYDEIYYNDKKYSYYGKLEEKFINNLTEISEPKMSIVTDAYSAYEGQITIDYSELDDEKKLTLYSVDGINEMLYVVVKFHGEDYYSIYSNVGYAYCRWEDEEKVNDEDLEELYKSPLSFLSVVGFEKYVQLTKSYTDISFSHKKDIEENVYTLSYYPEDDKFLKNMLEILFAEGDGIFKCTASEVIKDHSFQMEFYHELLGKMISLYFDREGNLGITMEGKDRTYVYSVDNKTAERIISYIIDKYEGKLTKYDYSSKLSAIQKVGKINAIDDYAYDDLVQEYLWENYREYTKDRYYYVEKEELLHNPNEHKVIKAHANSWYAAKFNVIRFNGALYKCAGLLSNGNNVGEILGSAVSYNEKTGEDGTNVIDVYSLNDVSEKIFIIGKTEKMDTYALYCPVFDESFNAEHFPKDIGEFCEMLGLSTYNDVFFARLNTLYCETKMKNVPVVTTTYYYMHDCMEFIGLMTGNEGAKYVGFDNKMDRDNSFSFFVYHSGIEHYIKFNYYNDEDNRGNLRVGIYAADENNIKESKCIMNFEFDTEKESAYNAVDYMIKKYIPVKIDDKKIK